MCENMLLQLSGVEKSFSGVSVLKGIDLRIEAGKVYSLAGENGAGKSTLCNIITGALAPTAGQLIANGKTYDRFTVDQAKQLGIRMVHQELQVLPDMSIAENLFVGDEVQKHGLILKKEMYRQTRELLKLVGLNMDPRTPLRLIDIASRQLIEIARASKGKAKLIILDEPTSSLSGAEVQRLFAIIKQYKERGTAFLFISHRIEELLEISDEIIVLKDGNLISSLEPSKTTEEEIVMKMVGRNYSDYYNRKREYFGKEALRVVNMSGVQTDGFSNAYTPQNISFSLCEGEVLGIAGLVGAGRTELVRLLFGQDEKKPGSEVYLYGEKVEIKNIGDALKRGLVWVTEDRKKDGVIQDFSIKSNIVIPILKQIRRRLFIKAKQESEIADQYIDLLHIKTSGRNQQIRYLSGGNQQKVVMAKWLATKPRIMVLDEPTRGIDVGAKSEIYKLINRLTEDGIAVLLISSELPEVVGMSDRILVMYEGRVAGEIERPEFSEEKIMMYATGRSKQP